MRPSCPACAKKHLAQAMILLAESKKGYPEHKTLALGHMAEAEDELILKYPLYANKIRAKRLKIESNTGNGDLLKLITEIDTHCHTCDLASTQPKTHYRKVVQHGY